MGVFFFAGWGMRVLIDGMAPLSPGWGFYYTHTATPSSSSPPPTNNTHQQPTPTNNQQMFYAFFAPLESFAVPALKSMAGFTASKASLGASILPALSVVLSPPFGILVDFELGKSNHYRRRHPWLQRLWPPGSTQLWAMLLPALGIAAIIVHPALWAVGFGLISLGYALSCASLWIVIPECTWRRKRGGGGGGYVVLSGHSLRFLSPVLHLCHRVGVHCVGGWVGHMDVSARSRSLSRCLACPELNGTEPQKLNTRPTLPLHLLLSPRPPPHTPQNTPPVVPTRSLGLAFGLIHAVDDAGILAVQVAIGRMLDQGKSYRGSVLPVLLSFALLGAMATLVLMRLLRRKIDGGGGTGGLELRMQEELLAVQVATG
jgi:hypothetical protein